MALDVRLSEWCCSVTMVWVQIPSREEQKIAIIYACSVAHAAANFKQYDEYGAPLNYPFILTGTPPTDKASSFYYHFLFSL
jgi:hypothetical protein